MRRSLWQGIRTRHDAANVGPGAQNQCVAGVTNAEFLEGHIEAIALPEAAIDVVLSNGVINLSGDKDQVLHEPFRVRKPGGRFAASNIVQTGKPHPLSGSPL